MSHRKLDLNVDFFGGWCWQEIPCINFLMCYLLRDDDPLHYEKNMNMYKERHHDTDFYKNKDGVFLR